MDKYKKLLPRTASIGKNGKLEIAGYDVRTLAEKWGTPLYMYDGTTIREKIESLYKLGSEEYLGEFDITYASKAYLSLGFARHLANMGVGVDVVSLGEMKIAKKAGFSPMRVHLHGNNKSHEELEYALDWGIFSIVVDSLEELDFLEKLAAQKQKKGSGLVKNHARSGCGYTPLSSNRAYSQQIWASCFGWTSNHCNTFVQSERVVRFDWPAYTCGFSDYGCETVPTSSKNAVRDCV